MARSPLALPQPAPRPTGRRPVLLSLMLIVALLAPGLGVARSVAAAEGTPVAADLGLRGEYFDNADLTAPKLTRLDPAIDFDWGADPPAAGIDPDTFSIRWTGEILIDHSETYTFTTVTDDGLRLWVDGRQVINQWADRPIEESAGSIRLVGGRWYPVTLEYYDNERAARVLLAYASPSTPSQVVPADHLRPAPASAAPPQPGGLRGEYFNNIGFADLEVVRIDPGIAFDWGAGSPDAQVDPDDFSVRWTGEVLADRSATYTFSVRSDDGARLWIDDRELIDAWTHREAQEDRATIDLQAGEWYAVRLEYFEAAGGAEIAFEYEAAEVPKQPVPADHLRPAAGAVGPSVPATDAGSGDAAAPATPATFPETTGASTETGASCDAPLQALVDAAEPGSVLRLPACVYRETVRITKPLTVDGSGAEIRGSDVWADGWIRRGDAWVHFGRPELPNPYGWCREGTERCHWPHQVFLDGAPLLQVEANPKPGQFAVGDDEVLLADDPAGRTVEVTTRSAWVVVEANDVTIQGFTMRHAGNPADTGAIYAREQDGLTVRDNRLSDAHGQMVTFTKGSKFRLLDNDLSRGGAIGAGASEASDVRFAGNAIHHNNTEGFDPGWSAGGTKSAAVAGFVVEANHVYANDGPGIWCDIDCAGVTIRDNRVHHNGRQGIQLELSRDALIAGNAVWENGWGFPSWCFGAGILVQNSASVEVAGNTLAWNAHGITVISQDRGDRWNEVTDTFIHDNVVVAIGKGDQAGAYCEDWPGGVLFEPSAQNRGADNGYWFPDPECVPAVWQQVDSWFRGCGHGRFGWNNQSFATLAEFNAASGSDHGRYLSDAEKDRALAATGIPTSPEIRD